MREGSLSTRVAFLDEFGRVIAVDDLDVPTGLDADGPVARRVAELLNMCLSQSKIQGIRT